MKKDKTTKDTSTIVFFDLYKAYDTVPRDLLIENLQKFKWPWNILKLKNYKLNKFTIETGSEIIKTHRWLIQGSVISPILFDIYVLVDPKTNSTVIHGISAKYFFVRKWGFYDSFQGISPSKREFSFGKTETAKGILFWLIRIPFFEGEFPGKGSKPHFLT